MLRGGTSPGVPYPLSCLCACTCTHALVHSCACAFMHTCTHAHICTCTHSHMHTCACAHSHTHTLQHAHVQACAQEHVPMCTHARVHTCARMCACAHMCALSLRLTALYSMPFLLRSPSCFSIMDFAVRPVGTRSFFGSRLLKIVPFESSIIVLLQVRWLQHQHQTLLPPMGEFK